MFENKFTMIDWNERENCPLEINIPENVIKSYHGRYSEIIWEVISKVDLSLRQDFNIISMIEVLW
jgi:hypothetical protein